ARPGASAGRRGRSGSAVRGGRCAGAGDGSRIPALWISRKAPKLGRCREGNPRTWLGMASAGARRTA
ncbi:DUF5701 family protein, partial [Streptomyces altiplanensis]